MLARNAEHPLEMHHTEPALLRVSPPGNVEHRENTVENPSILLATVSCRLLIENTPLVPLLLFVCDVVLGADSGRADPIPFTRFDRTIPPTSLDIGSSLNPCPRKLGAQ